MAIVSLDRSDAPWVARSDVAVHALGEGTTSYRYSAALVPWLREHASRYDAVIVNGLWQYLGFAAWRALRRGPTPYFVFPHGMLDPWFKRAFPVKHLKKWLFWPWADYRVLRDATAVIFTSEEERIEARKSFALYRCNEVVSPLGVDDPGEANASAGEVFLTKHPELRDTRILLFLGRLHPKKGCDLLIEALSEVRAEAHQLSLVFAGPDQIGWGDELRRLIDTRKVTIPVVFTGMLQGEIKRGALEAADAFVLPSHQENFGLSVVEALACSLPVLISRRVNIWREIVEDDAGFAEDDDRAGTVRLLERWFQTEEQVRQRMRHNARRCFERRFEIRKAAELLVDVLTRNGAAA